MKKIISLIIVIIIVTIVVMPYITGRVAEQVSLQLVDQLNAQPNEYGEVEIANYERGLSNTDMQFSWAPAGAYAALFDQPLEYRCKGDHGVFEYSYQCKAQNVDGYTAFVEEYLEGNDPLTLGGSVSIFGTVTQLIELEPFTMTDDQGDQLSVNPGQLSISTDRNFTTFAIDGRFEGLNAKGDTGDFTVSDISGEGSVRLNKHNLYIGDMDISLDSIDLSPNQGEGLTMQDIKVLTVTRENGESLEMEYQFNVAELAQRKSPASDEQLDIKNVDMSFAIKGAPMAAVAVLNEKIQAISSQNVDDQNAAMLSLGPDLESIFKTGFGVQTELSANYKTAPVNAAANIKLVGDLLFSDFLLLSVNPGGFFSKFEAGLQTAVPQSVLDSNPQAKFAISDNPLYSKTADGYRADIRLDKGRVNLNGQDMSIEEMLALLSQSVGG